MLTDTMLALLEAVEEADDGDCGCGCEGAGDCYETSQYTLREHVAVVLEAAEKAGMLHKNGMDPRRFR